MFAVVIRMLFALPILAVGFFGAMVLHRLKIDVEKEKLFRSQLSGLDLEKTRIPLA